MTAYTNIMNKRGTLEDTETNKLIREYGNEALQKNPVLIIKQKTIEKEMSGTN